MGWRPSLGDEVDGQEEGGVDLRNLNKTMPKEFYHFPCIERHSVHELPNFMDAYSSYNLIKIAKTNVSHTTF